MNVTIGAFDANARSVPVTFEDTGRRHSRHVNACLKTDGTYDATATEARVDAVGLGVLVKMNLGVIALDAEPDEAPTV